MSRGGGLVTPHSFSFLGLTTNMKSLHDLGQKGASPRIEVDSVGCCPSERFEEGVCLAHLYPFSSRFEVAEDASVVSLGLSSGVPHKPHNPERHFRVQQQLASEDPYLEFHCQDAASDCSQCGRRLCDCGEMPAMSQLMVMQEGPELWFEEENLWAAVGRDQLFCSPGVWAVRFRGPSDEEFGTSDGQANLCAPCLEEIPALVYGDCTSRRHCDRCDRRCEVYFCLLYTHNPFRARGCPRGGRRGPVNQMGRGTERAERPPGRAGGRFDARAAGQVGPAAPGRGRGRPPAPPARRMPQNGDHVGANARARRAERDGIGRAFDDDAAWAPPRRRAPAQDVPPPLPPREDLGELDRIAAQIAAVNPEPVRDRGPPAPLLLARLLERCVAPAFRSYEDSCSICQRGFGEVSVFPCCGGQMHVACVTAWARVDHLCPLCRHNYSVTGSWPMPVWQAPPAVPADVPAVVAPAAVARDLQERVFGAAPPPVEAAPPDDYVRPPDPIREPEALIGPLADLAGAPPPPPPPPPGPGQGPVGMEMGGEEEGEDDDQGELLPAVDLRPRVAAAPPQRSIADWAATVCVPCAEGPATLFVEGVLMRETGRLRNEGMQVWPIARAFERYALLEVLRREGREKQQMRVWFDGPEDDRPIVETWGAADDAMRVQWVSGTAMRDVSVVSWLAFRRMSPFLVRNLIVQSYSNVAYCIYRSFDGCMGVDRTQKVGTEVLPPEVCWQRIDNTTVRVDDGYMQGQAHDFGWLRDAPDGLACSVVAAALDYALVEIRISAEPVPLRLAARPQFEYVSLGEAPRLSIWDSVRAWFGGAVQRDVVVARSVLAYIPNAVFRPMGGTLDDSVATQVGGKMSALLPGAIFLQSIYPEMWADAVRGTALYCLTHNRGQVSRRLFNIRVEGREEEDLLVRARAAATPREPEGGSSWPFWLGGVLLTGCLAYWWRGAWVPRAGSIAYGLYHAVRGAEPRIDHASKLEWTYNPSSVLNVYDGPIVRWMMMWSPIGSMPRVAYSPPGSWLSPWMQANELKTDQLNFMSPFFLVMMQVMSSVTLEEIFRYFASMRWNAVLWTLEGIGYVAAAARNSGGVNMAMVLERVVTGVLLHGSLTMLTWLARKPTGRGSRVLRMLVFWYCLLEHLKWNYWCFHALLAVPQNQVPPFAVRDEIALSPGPGLVPRWTWLALAALGAAGLVWQRARRKREANLAARWMVARQMMEGFDGVGVEQLHAPLVLESTDTQLYSPPDILDMRGRVVLTLHGAEMSYDAFVSVLLQENLHTAIYAYAANSGCLFRPSGGPVSMAAALFYRTCMNPYAEEVRARGVTTVAERDSVIAEIDARLWSRWDASFRKICAEGFALPTDLDEPMSIERYATRLTKDKRERFLKAAEEWYRGVPARPPTCMPKSDEVLGIKMVETSGGPVLTIKPRAIVVFTPQLGPMFGPIVKSLHYAMRDMWSFDRVHMICGVAVRLVYASGSNPEDLENIAMVLRESSVSVVVVAGDDVIVKVVSEGAVYFLECDLGQCDQTLGVGPHDIVLPALFRSAGIPMELWDTLMDFKRGRLSYKHKRTSAQAVVQPWPIMMDTGSPITTTGTSAVTLVAYLLALLGEISGESFEKVLEGLGLRPKVQRFETLLGATFLRGLFAEGTDGHVHWYPLPNPCKLGKMFTPLEQAVRKCPLQLRLRPVETMCLAAAGAIRVPENFPILASYKRALARCARGVEVPIDFLEYHRRERGQLVRTAVGSLVPVDRDFVLQMIVERYGITVRDVEEVEALLDTVERGPVFVAHPVFQLMAARDYA